MFCLCDFAVLESLFLFLRLRRCFLKYFSSLILLGVSVSFHFAFLCAFLIKYHRFSFLICVSMNGAGGNLVKEIIEEIKTTTTTC